MKVVSTERRHMIYVFGDKHVEKSMYNDLADVGTLDCYQNPKALCRIMP